MEKFVPYEKLSKSKKRELDRKKRSTWGSVCPATRKEKNLKKYDRKKSRRTDFYSDDFGIFCIV